MKKYIYLLSWILIAGFAACKEEDFSAEEHYKYVVYLLSTENYNVYQEVFPFDNGNEVKGYFSVGCGGSLTNPEAFTVELEKDTVLFDYYNKANFDIDVTKYANLLPENRYEIETSAVTFPEKNPDQYVKVAVSVKPDGLSPDSIYFIPVSIKSVSKYEVNPEKQNLLIRVALSNYYAEQLNTTYYQMKGNVLDENGDPVSTLATTKLARPLTKNAIRIYAGNMAQTTSSSYEDIRKYSIVVSVDENKRVQIAPYGSIEIEQLNDGEEPWNSYTEARANAVDETIIKWFYLHYRYRTLKTPATETTPAVYNNWVTVKETLKRLE